MVEMFPESDESCKVTDARGSTDPKHEDRRKPQRAHPDHTTGHELQTENLTSSWRGKTRDMSAKEGKGTADVSSEKSQTTAKQHQDFYTTQKCSKMEAITSFSENSKAVN